MVGSTTRGSGGREHTVIVDAHAHIYPVFDLNRFFHVARERAQRADAALLLLLTESAGLHYFEALQALAGGDGPGTAFDPPNLRAFARDPRLLRATDEAASLGVLDDGGPAVFLIAGRQVVSRERLEVHAIGLAPGHGALRVADGELTTQALVERFLLAGAATVLPWGFGKWLGARGREVTRLAALTGVGDHPLFFLGDIAARCRPFRSPQSCGARTRVLPGSDILPLPRAEYGLARYGFRLSGSLDRSRPAASLLTLLHGTPSVEPLGRRQGVLAAAVQQLRYRLRGDGRA